MASQKDIQEQQKLLEIHRRNLAHYVYQLTVLGGRSYANPGTMNGIYGECGQIRRIKKILASWNVHIQNGPNDDYDVDVLGAPGGTQPPDPYRSSPKAEKQSPKPSVGQNDPTPKPHRPIRTVTTVAGALRLILTEQPNSWLLAVENRATSELTEIEVCLYPSFDLFVPYPELSIPRLLPGGRSYDHALGLRQSTFRIATGISYTSAHEGYQQFDITVEAGT